MNSRERWNLAEKFAQQRRDRQRAIEEFLSKKIVDDFYCPDIVNRIEKKACNARRYRGSGFYPCSGCVNFKYYQQGLKPPKKNPRKYADGIIRIRFRNRRRCSSNPAYGFRNLDGHYAYNPSEIRILLFIELVREKMRVSYQSIADVLNSLGLSQRNGKQFTTQLVRGLYHSYKNHLEYFERYHKRG